MTFFLTFSGGKSIYISVATSYCQFDEVPLPSLTPDQARNSRDTGKSPSSLGLADFDLLRVIGRGSYAKVLLVQLKKTERIYAMKVVKKELVNDDEVSGHHRACML